MSNIQNSNKNNINSNHKTSTTPPPPPPQKPKIIAQEGFGCRPVIISSNNGINHGNSK